MKKNTQIQVQPTASVATMDAMNIELNSAPNPEWIKTHPYIKDYKYMDISTVQFLLKKYFKQYRIEILREGTSFNGVYVVVRLWYAHPVTGVMEFHDGIGSEALQTKKGASPADLANINPGALTMAFPKAKTTAIKNAAKNFGRLFGADLNEAETETKDFSEPLQIGEINHDDLVVIYSEKSHLLTENQREQAERILHKQEKTSYRKMYNYLRNL
tara:strand:+ start:3169 stop:3813 length:645 start_codon:yes stop_codon:yes gene_type:complete